MQLDPITVEKLAPMWFEWANYGTPEERHAFNSFGIAWLRDVVIDEHPCKHWRYDGADHANRDRYHRRDDR